MSRAWVSCELTPRGVFFSSYAPSYPEHATEGSAASMATTVRRQLRDGTLHAGSLLTEVRGIGDYLEARLRRALGRAAPLRVGDLWDAMRHRATADVDALLRTALQNARANQCVPTRQGEPCTYHAGDVNQHGHAACVALLEHARRTGAPVRYARLPSPPTRGVASKECGCRGRADCIGPCRWADGTCVPASTRARGFLGSAPHPDQTERANTAADVRRRSRSRTTAAARADPHTRADVRAGHSPRLQYVRSGRRLWRKPGAKVRVPAAGY